MGDQEGSGKPLIFAASEDRAALGRILADTNANLEPNTSTYVEQLESAASKTPTRR